MSYKKKGKKGKTKKIDFDHYNQNEHFYFIAGYTSNGVAYGTSWEEAYEDGLIKGDKEEPEITDKSLPF